MKKGRIILLSLAISSILISCSSIKAEGLTKNYDLDNQIYSSQMLDINYSDKTVTYEELAKNLGKLTGKKISDSADPIKAIIEATNFTKFTLTYSDEKANSRLKYYGIDELGNYDPKYVASALDANFIDKIDFTILNSYNNEIPNEIAYYITMVVARELGLSRNYIGNVSDSDILYKVASAFNELYMYSYDKLNKLGATLVQEKASTGFNIKLEGYSANFLPERTITYGHSDKNHLMQLIALLNSENIDAKIQIEPKTSIYEYLKEWGPFPQSTPDYRVDQYSDYLALVNAVEYDVKFEFINEEDMKKFDSIINKYAKKNSENQAEGVNVNLIEGAWWQPLYYTSKNNIDESAYSLIVDNVAIDNGYSIHPFSLVDESKKLEKQMNKISGLDVVPKPIFVNNAFYRYLTGTSWE